MLCPKTPHTTQPIRLYGDGETSIDVACLSLGERSSNTKTARHSPKLRHGEGSTDEEA